MPYEIKILKIEKLNLKKEAVSTTWHLQFEGDDEGEYYEVADHSPTNAMYVIRRMFDNYGDDDMYAAITNILDEIKDDKIDILVGDELVPFGEFEHLYEGG
jgi:hypothetical protein